MTARLATDSDLPLDAEMLEWAEARFSQATRRAPIVVLGVRDEYRFMQPDLVAILRASIAHHLH